MFRSPISSTSGSPYRSTSQPPDNSSLQSLDGSSNIWELLESDFGPPKDNIRSEDAQRFIDETKNLYLHLTERLLKHLKEQERQLITEKEEMIHQNGDAGKDYPKIFFNFYKDIKVVFHTRIACMMKYGETIAHRDSSYVGHIINKEDEMLKSCYRIIIHLHNGAQLLKDKEDKTKFERGFTRTTYNLCDIMDSDQFLRSCEELKTVIISSIGEFGDKCSKLYTEGKLQNIDV